MATNNPNENIENIGNNENLEKNNNNENENTNTTEEETNESGVKKVNIVGSDLGSISSISGNSGNSGSSGNSGTKKNTKTNTNTNTKTNTNTNNTKKNNKPSNTANTANTTTNTTNTNVEAPMENKAPTNISNDTRKSLDRLAMNLLNHQVVLKLFHFQTEQYGAHKASDAYLEKFAGVMDRFLEIAQGIYGKITIKKYGLNGSSHTDENILRHLNGMITYLREKIDDVLGNYTDLINIRDELVGDLEQLKYLLTFK
jgi:hypothetical protein